MQPLKITHWRRPNMDIRDVCSLFLEEKEKSSKWHIQKYLVDKTISPLGFALS